MYCSSDLNALGCTCKQLLHSLTWFYLDHQIMEAQVDGAHSMHGGYDKCLQNFGGKPEWKQTNQKT